MKTFSLKDLKSPHELSSLSIPQCEAVCGEIRRKIIKTVLRSGGHLSSNLGAVELTAALHRVFRSPADKIVWDVGHQVYAHKLLTGRYDDFDTLRKEGGISGFCRPDESEHDAFISGHSSTSISAALGIAEAMRQSGDKHHVIAVIGDGAFTGGMAYEGLNNAGKSSDNLIIILNHNDMSISKNVGAFARYLTSLRGSTAYLNAKKRVEKILDKTPVVGEPVKKFLLTSKSTLKSVLYHSTMFEDMGFVYLGPIDGHNIAELEEALRAAKKLRRPVFVHVNTIKGKGFRPAEINPGAFHSIPSKGYDKSNPENVLTDAFSETAGKAVCRLAEKDSNICAITAAMKYATGLQHFAAQFPERFYDVGIAEQHAVTFAAGLAKGGKLPYFGVYSSFLQRAYDQIIHDASIDPAHIVLGIGNAGFVGEDGETHQGLFDVPMLLTIPNVTIYSPSTYGELELCMESAFYRTEGVAAVRYPKGCETASIGVVDTDSFLIIENGRSKLAVSYGRIVHNLYELGNCDILKLVRLYPIDEQVVEICMKYEEIYFFEESSRRGGMGETLLAELYRHGYRGSFNITAVDGFVKQASVESCLDRYGLSAEKMKMITEYYKLRLDVYLAQSGLAKSRERAKELIKEGKVTVDRLPVSKPAFEVDDTAVVEVTGKQLKYVGRGGLKLERALEAFGIELAGRVCIDIGASTGGFTDCMLQNGAAYVYAVDTGRGQLDEKLRNDPRVLNMEKTNILDLPAAIFPKQPDFISADVSFVSLTKILPKIKDLLPPEGEAVTLIKPQFEAGRANIGKNGIVKDRKVHEAVLMDIFTCCTELGLNCKEIIPSPIKGGDGNIEYLAHIKRGTGGSEPDFIKIVENAFSDQ